jgi:uncharacterized membrane protein YgcG
VRNPIRNTLHKELKEKITDILQHRIRQSGLDRKVLEGEPILEDFYERSASAPISAITQSSEDMDTLPNYRNEHGVKVRADMAVLHRDQNRTILVDFTFTEPTAACNGPYEQIGSAAIKAVVRKEKEYRHWDIVNSADSLVTFAVETFVVVGKAAKDFLISFIDPSENTSLAKQLLYQQLSVALHTMRAKQFNRIKKDFTLDSTPLTPSDYGRRISGTSNSSSSSSNSNSISRGSSGSSSSSNGSSSSSSSSTVGTISTPVT